MSSAVPICIHPAMTQSGGAAVPRPPAQPALQCAHRFFSIERDFKDWQAAFACYMVVSSSDRPCRPSPMLSKDLLLQASSWRLHLQ